MSIDFHDQRNQTTYASRTAEEKWIQTIQQYVDIQGKQVLDLGCGGGIYSKVFAMSGAAHVTAMDFSLEMLKGAQANCKELSNIDYVQGNAWDTGLVDEQMDVLLERALIHHIDDLDACFQEANRILKSEGRFIIQDRTPEDCSLPGSETHIRGYFFEKYPRLLDKEIKRRHSSEQVQHALQDNGFELIAEVSFWETRRVYAAVNELEEDLLQRTGRSILHDLSDEELVALVSYIKNKLGDSISIKEEDRWTIWIAKKK